MYLGDASYVLGIEIHRDRSKGALGLSRKAYIEKVLKRYNMHKCSSTTGLVAKGDKFRQFQSPRNQLDSICFSCRKHYVCTSVYSS